jgi:hypothetical protein
MAKLSSAARASLPKSTFALPGGTKASKGPSFPIPDKNHARVAKSYAAKEVKSGDITPAQKARVDKMADSKLGKSKSGKK